MNIFEFVPLFHLAFIAIQQCAGIAGSRVPDSLPDGTGDADFKVEEEQFNKGAMILGGANETEVELTTLGPSHTFKRWNSTDVTQWSGAGKPGGQNLLIIVILPCILR